MVDIAAADNGDVFWNPQASLQGGLERPHGNRVVVTENSVGKGLQFQQSYHGIVTADVSGIISRSGRDNIFGGQGKPVD
jgi:hypothetical protein